VAFAGAATGRMINSLVVNKPSLLILEILSGIDRVSLKLTRISDAWDNNI
jgi:hypothetical protein